MNSSGHSELSFPSTKSTEHCAVQETPSSHKVNYVEYILGPSAQAIPPPLPAKPFHLNKSLPPSLKVSRTAKKIPEDCAGPIVGAPDSVVWGLGTNDTGFRDDCLLVEDTGKFGHWITDFDEPAHKNSEDYIPERTKECFPSSASSCCSASTSSNENFNPLSSDITLETEPNYREPLQSGYTKLNGEQPVVENSSADEMRLFSLDTDRGNFIRDIYLKIQPSVDRSLPAHMVRIFFKKSGLSEHDLNHLWSLIQWNQDNNMTFPQFLVAMQLISVTKQQAIDLPSHLPDVLGDLLKTTGKAQWDLAFGGFFPPKSLSQTSPNSSIHPKSCSSDHVDDALGAETNVFSESVLGMEKVDSSDDSNSSISNFSSESSSKSHFSGKGLSHTHPIQKKDYSLLMESCEWPLRQKQARRNSLQIDKGFKTTNTQCGDQKMTTLPQSNSDHQTLQKSSLFGSPSTSGSMYGQLLNVEERQSLVMKLKSQKQRNYTLLRFRNELENEMREVTEQYFYLNMRFQKLCKNSHILPFSTVMLSASN